MKTPALRQLGGSVTRAMQCHLAASLLASEPRRQAAEREVACRAAAALEAIRAELATRDACTRRTPADRRRATRKLRRALQAFPELDRTHVALPLVPAAIAGERSLRRPGIPGVGGVTDDAGVSAAWSGTTTHTSPARVGRAG